jgi:hypothetical protein
LVVAQTAMLLMFRYTRWQSQFERCRPATVSRPQHISALTVAVVMLWPQILLLMPLYVTLAGGTSPRRAEDGTP